MPNSNVAVMTFAARHRHKSDKYLGGDLETKNQTPHHRPVATSGRLVGGGLGQVGDCRPEIPEHSPLALAFLGGKFFVAVLQHQRD